MKPQHIVARNMSWASDILEHVQVPKLDHRQFFYDPIRKIISKSLNSDAKGMIGCYSAEIINKMTLEISKSLNTYLLNQFNSVLDISAKSIKDILAVLQGLTN